MYDQKIVLITLLIQLGVAAAVSSALTRSRVFQNLLFAPYRTVVQTFGLLAFICVPLTLGVLVRTIVPNFLAADISFETAILLGLLIGPFSGIFGGIILSLPALYHHEFLALPFNVAVGGFAGICRQFIDEEDVWSFSPFVDLSLYRWVKRALKSPSHLDRQILLLCMIFGLQIVRMVIALRYPGRLFSVDTPGIWIRVAILATAAMVVGIPLKIWNALRLERKLEEQNRFLLEMRMEALQRQINPHFLFNTLNSIASLVRFRPELARDMIVKLANILRMLLKQRESFVPFSEELEFTDDYLDIEVVRFGAEKLRVKKEIDPDSLDILVPSMLLQPLIENSIKHGLEPRIGGGTVTLRSRVQNGILMIEVEDDGVGMGADIEQLQGLEPREIRLGNSHDRGTGIGMRNVQERLKVLYGLHARFAVISRPGRGTRITMEMPLKQSAALEDYALRARTRS